VRGKLTLTGDQDQGTVVTLSLPVTPVECAPGAEGYG